MLQIFRICYISNPMQDRQSYAVLIWVQGYSDFHSVYLSSLLYDYGHC